MDQLNLLVLDHEPFAGTKSRLHGKNAGARLGGIQRVLTENFVQSDHQQEYLVGKDAIVVSLPPSFKLDHLELAFEAISQVKKVSQFSVIAISYEKSKVLANRAGDAGAKFGVSERSNERYQRAHHDVFSALRGVSFALPKGRNFRGDCHIDIQLNKRGGGIIRLGTGMEVPAAYIRLLQLLSDQQLHGHYVCEAVASRKASNVVAPYVTHMNKFFEKEAGHKPIRSYWGLGLWWYGEKLRFASPTAG